MSSTRRHGPGWAAAGDAAGLISPLTGEGIDYPLIGSTSWKLVMASSCSGSGYVRWLCPLGVVISCCRVESEESESYVFAGGQPGVRGSRPGGDVEFQVQACHRAVRSQVQSDSEVSEGAVHRFEQVHGSAGRAGHPSGSPVPTAAERRTPARRHRPPFWLPIPQRQPSEQMAFAFAQARMTGLSDALRPGRPRTMTDEQVTDVVMTTLEKAPKECYSPPLCGHWPKNWD